MKYIRDHVMFIFSLLAILLGIESFLVFDRLTKNYEQDLKADYSMLILANKSMTLSELKQINFNISAIDIIKKQAIVDEMAEGMSDTSADDIMNALPFFYTVRFGSYLDNSALEQIKEQLIASEDIKKVETFGKNHNSNYNLFVFIKIVLWTFVTFMSLTSIFLVIKQMEIWQFAHRERMQVMEIFGASTMLRSGILFKRAIADALIATVITSGLFIFLRFVWVKTSNIEILVNKQELLFEYKDIAILGGISLLIVIVAVIVVVVSSKENKL